MEFQKITEKDSIYDNIEKKSIYQIINEIHNEDFNALKAIKETLPVIEKVIEKIIFKLKKGGRLFYIGAGTSGRLGVLDASECPPTFGTDPDKVLGIIAGGDKALRNSIEDAEDNFEKGWDELIKYNVNSKDFVIGIAASGSTPFVVGALKECKNKKIQTACICSNPNSPVTKFSDYSIEVVVGPEYITGSSRMKAGTAQKLVLNMISTTTMIKLGHVKDNKMIDIQITNQKLVDRARRIISKNLNIDYSKAKSLLNKYKSVRNAINSFNDE
ncbi:MAG: N-acetylmuramic acid 6-phosphate etherase [Flavobacteriaceae bacterium]|nr:N-acetylmuramic acid 6-phosphate etherase [Flavobacteriaceae bacterium]